MEAKKEHNACIMVVNKQPEEGEIREKRWYFYNNEDAETAASILMGLLEEAEIAEYIDVVLVTKNGQGRFDAKQFQYKEAH